MFSLPFAEFVDHAPGIDLVPLDAARPVAEMGAHQWGPISRPVYRRPVAGSACDVSLVPGFKLGTGIEGLGVP
jgi:hypothetical protein